MHTSDSYDRLRKSHITQNCCGYHKLEYLDGYYKGSLMLLWQELPRTYAVAADYSHGTFRGTPTCSSHSDFALYETHVAGQ